MIGIDLSGKTALVTGAAQGLGKEIAVMLSEAGARVVINYFEEGEGKQKALAQQLCRELKGESAAVCADIRDQQAVDAMFDEAEHRFGSVDIVVNNAGILRDRSLKKITESEWQQVIDTNLTGVFHVTKTASQRTAQGGRIISISSIAAFMGFFGQASYASAKAGVTALTKVAARECARRQITVNAVAPGVALTEMGRSIPETAREKMLQGIPLGRFAEPAEVANTVLFLASSLASYITGQTIHVNGGWYL